MKPLRIVFMGTPEFAAGILDTMIESGYNVVGVITAADKPAGRGQKIKYSAVKEYALKRGLKLLQPTNLKSEEFLSELKALDANLQVVVAFRMLPEVVWKMPEYGTFNLHASLLPDYRGAAPINWAIINGEEKTGVTTFFIDDKIDTGAMILSAETPIGADENAGQLHDRLMNLGSETVIKTLKLIETGDANPTIQAENADLKTAYKLNRENCMIDWSKPGIEIHNLIRGLSPYPAAWTTFKDNDQEWQVKIYRGSFAKALHSNAIGTIVSEKKTLKIATTDGYIEVLELQLPGKKKMNTAELLNGMAYSASAQAM
ncbi:MAG: methionyl-tRNA formyltransferase [Flavobacterium sp.]|nr:MAG: methionyl-tRNA formyltransferase [Flavobacterium sp.]